MFRGVVPSAGVKLKESDNAVICTSPRTYFLCLACRSDHQGGRRSGAIVPP